MSKRRDAAIAAEPAAIRPLIFDRIALARVSSGVGALALIVAILAVVLQHGITLLSSSALLIGLAGIALWTVLAPGELRAIVTGRQARYGTNSVFVSILMIGIIAILYSLTANSGVAADLTQMGYYTIKHDIETIVGNIEQPIQITAFYNTSQLDNQSLDTPILQMFADAAPGKIKLAVLDPDEQALLAKRLGLVGPLGIFISQLDSQGQPDPQRTVRVQASYARESAIAEAILRLQASGKYKVYFTVGHDEIDTDIQKQADAYGIRAGVEGVGIQTATLDLRNDQIPRDATAIVMLRPQTDLNRNEVEKLAKYLGDGGKLLIMAKPAYVGAIKFMTTPDSPMTTYLWDTWGIRPQNDIVFEPDSSGYIGNPYRLLSAQVNTKTPIMYRDASGTTQIRPLLTIAQSWEVKPELASTISFTPLIYTSAKAIGKKNLQKVARNPDDPANLTLESGDLKGPLLMAAALENTRNQARLIVVGDADWVYNDPITHFDGQYFWTNMIEWLTHYLTNITVHPTVKQLPLLADSGSLNIVVLVSLVILPGIVLLTGGIVWWDRQRRQ